MPELSDPIACQVVDVARLLRARTKDDAGRELGTFTADTRPTAESVQGLIDMAVGWLRAKTGDAFEPGLGDDGVTAVPSPYLPLAPAAQGIVALRAAMLVELTYYPEQVRTDRSAYTEYKDLLAEGLADLTAGLDGDAGPTAQRTVMVPVLGLLHDHLDDGPVLYTDQLAGWPASDADPA